MANNYANLLVYSLFFKQQSPVHDVSPAMVFYIWYSFCKLFSLFSFKYQEYSDSHRRNSRVPWSNMFRDYLDDIMGILLTLRRWTKLFN